MEKLDFRKMMPPPNPNVSAAESITPNNTANPDQRYLIISTINSVKRGPKFGRKECRTFVVPAYMRS